MARRKANGRARLIANAGGSHGIEERAATSCDVRLVDAIVNGDDTTRMLASWIKYDGRSTVSICFNVRE